MSKRRGSDAGAAPDEDDGSSLDAPEHAWWASSPGGDAAGESTTVDEDDPYVVLKVDKDASWDDIVVSYRKLARWWHPDGLTNPAPGERELCEDMIRRLNIAYTQLRVRRGR
jgi:hypothetical protein